MKITLNGTPVDITPNCTLQQLIDDQGLTGKRLAAEVNLQIIPRAQHAECILQENDSVEIVQAIGGGQS